MYTMRCISGKTQSKIQWTSGLDEITLIIPNLAAAT